jgi:hypothetical protein
MPTPISRLCCCPWHIRPYPLENTGSRPLSLSQAGERLISSWVGFDQRIPAVVCFLPFFFFCIAYERSDISQVLSSGPRLIQCRVTRFGGISLQLDPARKAGARRNLRFRIKHVAISQRCQCHRSEEAYQCHAIPGPTGRTPRDRPRTRVSRYIRRSLFRLWSASCRSSPLRSPQFGNSGKKGRHSLCRTCISKPAFSAPGPYLGRDRFICAYCFHPGPMSRDLGRKRVD